MFLLFPRIKNVMIFSIVHLNVPFLDGTMTMVNRDQIRLRLGPQKFMIRHCLKHWENKLWPWKKQFILLNIQMFHKFFDLKEPGTPWNAGTTATHAAASFTRPTANNIRTINPNQSKLRCVKFTSPTTKSHSGTRRSPLLHSRVSGSCKRLAVCERKLKINQDGQWFQSGRASENARESRWNRAAFVLCVRLLSLIGLCINEQLRWPKLRYVIYLVLVSPI